MTNKGYQFLCRLRDQTACCFAYRFFVIFFWGSVLSSSFILANAANNEPLIELAPIEVDSTDYANLSFTEDEEEWLDNHPVIRQGILTASPPFEYVDESGRYRGLTSDYTAILSDKLGIEFEQIVYEDSDKLFQAMLSNEVDFSTYLYIEPGHSKSIKFRQSPVTIPIVLLGRRDMGVIPSLTIVGERKLAVQDRSRIHTLLQRDFPQISLYHVKDTVTGLQAVDQGLADLYIDNVLSADFCLRKYGIHTLKVLATTLYEYKLSFGSTREFEPLLGITNKVLVDLSSREKSLIFDKWANIQIEHEIDWKTVSVWGGSILTIIFITIFAILYWNKRLSVEVANRTRELENSSESLRKLARHMDRVREEEKAYLSREIHDELGHTLTALNMGLRRLARKINAGKSGINKTLQELRGLVAEATQASRRIMSDLRPGVLEDLGLIAAIEWLAQEFQSHSGVKCVVRATELPTKLEDGISISLFRITQEALTNVAKHANAELVEIDVDYSNHKLLLRICDNGKGLGLDSEAKENSMGLQGMHERALAIGGELAIEDRSEQDLCSGLCLTVNVPINATEKLLKVN